MLEIIDPRGVKRPLVGPNSSSLAVFKKKGERSIYLKAGKSFYADTDEEMDIDKKHWVFKALLRMSTGEQSKMTNHLLFGDYTSVALGVKIG